MREVVGWPEIHERGGLHNIDETSGEDVGIPGPGRAWFAGDEFTAADVMMSFPLEAARDRAGLDESRPHLIDWLERIHARPAYAEALRRGGPYAYA